MEKSGEQPQQHGERKAGGGVGSEDRGSNVNVQLPMESSPYTHYKDLEDYKMQGYGTQGHLQPQPGRGAASSTDAPTLSADKASAQSQLSATDAINRHGVP